MAGRAVAEPFREETNVISLQGSLNVVILALIPAMRSSALTFLRKVTEDGSTGYGTTCKLTEESTAKMATAEDVTISLAPVQRWNAHTVYLQCPFCSKTHTHGFGGSYTSSVRVAHCEHSSYLSHPSYRFAYSFSEDAGTTAYEIDKSVGFFVALGAKMLETDTGNIEKALDGLNLSEDELSNTRTWEDATEMITIGTEDEILRRLQEHFGGDNTCTLKRLRHVMSRMLIFEDHKYVEDYIRTSSEARLFLHGMDEEGNSALNLAACEKYPAMIKLLLDHGADVNHQNKNGKSSLMEAALWGRIENVKHLLEHGANRSLRDNHSSRAIELAESSLQNGEERHRRSGGEVPIYREVSFMANQARRVIFEMLKDPKDYDGRRVPEQDQMFQRHIFKKTDQQSIELIAPIAEFPIPTEWKTIASLQRPSNYPSIAAMSGWSHGETKITISGKTWTDEVRRISWIVGHELSIDQQRDKGVEGQFFASHAEKQLVAYFVSKHVLTECEEQELLQRAKPPTLLEQATILVSRPPCNDCSEFIEALNWFSVVGEHGVYSRAHVRANQVGWARGSAYLVGTMALVPGHAGSHHQKLAAWRPVLTYLTGHMVPLYILLRLLVDHCL